MKKLFLLSISTLLLVSCGNEPKRAAETEEVAQAPAPQEDAFGARPIELNKGQKWVLNVEMNTYVNQGAALVNRYLEANQTDYRRLAADLNDRTHKMIAANTLTGPAHDELHKWLEHHSNLIIALDLASDEKQARAVAGVIKGSYDRYKQYFQ
jgi:hypothetical protein